KSLRSVRGCCKDKETRSMRSSLVKLALLLLLAISQSAAAGDWPRFRGPNGAALSDDTATPVHWSASENIVWRTELPGSGASSPIITGGKVFLTCYTGSGSKVERIVVCI